MRGGQKVRKFTWRKLTLIQKLLLSGKVIR